MAGTSLKVLAADKGVEGVKKDDLFKVDPRLLAEEPGFNRREYDDPDVKAQIRIFADAYKAGQYVPPLIVRRNTEDGRVIVVEGHLRRLGALLAISEGAELSYVHCVPFSGNDLERTEVMLRSAQGLPLKPLAIALGYLQLKRMGLDNAEIAWRMGKTAARVEQMLLLANANSDVHEMVRAGTVAADAAIEAVREHGEKAGEFLRGVLEKLRDGGKERVTRGVIREWTPPRKVVTTVIGTVRAVFERMDKSTRRQLAEFEGMDPGQLKGKKVEIDAAVLLDLARAHGEVEEAASAKVESERAAKAKASQQSLDMDGNGGAKTGGNAASAPDQDPLYEQAVAVVRKEKQASISLVQRHLRIGYNRAARLLEAMESAKVVSAQGSSGERKVLSKARS